MPEVAGQAPPRSDRRHDGVAGAGIHQAALHPLDGGAQADRPHVLQVFEPRTGGVPRYTENLARGLVSLGWRVSVACPPQTSAGESLRASGIEVMPLEIRRSPRAGQDGRAIVKLARWCREHDVTLLHGHSTKAGMLVALAGARAKVPSVYTPHGWAFERLDSGPMRPSAAFLERQLASRYHAAVVTVSGSGRKAAERWRVTPRGRIQVVPTGLPPAPPILRTDARRQIGIDQDVPVAAWVGRIGPQKQPDHLAPIARWLAGDVRVVALCDGAHETGLAAELSGAGVRLLDPGFDPAVLYAASDLLIHTSAWEASPMVVLEAMSAGLPVVAYDVGGLGEQVRNGETGFLVGTGDIETMCERVLELAHEPAASAELGDRAHRRATASFNYSSMLEQIGQVYSAVAGTNAAGHRPAGRRASEIVPGSAANVVDLDR